MNIQIMRVFTRLRQILNTHKDLEIKLNEVIRIYNSKFKDHDEKFKTLFTAIQQLLDPPFQESKKKFGFLADRK